MTETPIRFDDGAAYEQMMGTWSRLVGDVFLDWVNPPAGLRWIDIGCGNGAFTQQIVDRCAPAEVLGVDPSDGQLAYARMRPAARVAKFQQGNAVALPAADRSFDVASMALVIFFVPDPAKGAAEMARVLRPGGVAAAYAWDLMSDGFPGDAIQVEMRAIGVAPMMPPSAPVSRIEALRKLWSDAGFGEIETRAITVQRTFADFEDYWTINMKGSGVGQSVAAMNAGDAERLKARVRARLLADDQAQVTVTARANAVKGRLSA